MGFGGGTGREGDDGTAAAAMSDADSSLEFLREEEFEDGNDGLPTLPF